MLRKAKNFVRPKRQRSKKKRAQNRLESLESTGSGRSGSAGQSPSFVSMLKLRFKKVKNLFRLNQHKGKKRKEQNETDATRSAHARLAEYGSDEQQIINSDAAAMSASAALQTPSQAYSLPGDSLAEPLNLGHSKSTTMSNFHGASNFKVNNPVFSNIQGSATYIQLFGDGPFTETQMQLFKKHLTELIAVQSSEHDANSIQEYCDLLCQSITTLMDEEELKVVDPLKNKLKNLCSELSSISVQACKDDGTFDANKAGREIGLKLETFSFACRMAGLIRMSNMGEKIEKHKLQQAVRDLPRANSAYNDYASKKRCGSCLEGTREALLTEIAEWILTELQVGVYVLSGLAGIGKSTVAYTVAERAENCGYLGASFFFSRDESDRKTAEKVFTTIAYQLCIYDEKFAEAIGGVLLEQRGSWAVSKDPREQLKALILDPLQDVAKSRNRPTVIVVDALDECEDRDACTVLLALSELVQGLPSFKVVLTTRPHPDLQFLLNDSERFTVFHLHNVEAKVVDHDVQLYLEHSLSQQQVLSRLPTIRRPWNASDDQIASLVSATGRLFIIASTAVLFILDKFACNPRVQMTTLLAEIAKGHTPFNTLNNFYTVILRNAVPIGCNRHMADRFQAVMGAIILIEEPLPIDALATLISQETDEIYAVVNCLQPIILLGSDEKPLIYNKSFPDYVMDPERCDGVNLLIDPKHHHTRMAICCFNIMNQCLKQNILCLDGPIRFMPNNEVLKEVKLETMIRLELRYGCIFWAKHVEGANIDDGKLMTDMKTFFTEHLLHWLEALSWIQKLDVVHHAVRTVQTTMTWAPDLQELLSDGLRFISRFYHVIEQTALHTYQRALPLVPTGTALYRKYHPQMSLAYVQGGPEKWDALVADGAHDKVVSTIFSLDSAMYASLGDGRLKLWDAVTGVPSGTIIGSGVTIAADFSVAASFKDDVIAVYDVKSTALIATIKDSSGARMLALSPDGNRIAAMLEGGTLSLWDRGSGERITSVDGPEWCYAMSFSQCGSKLAFSSGAGITLLDGMSGERIKKLGYEPHLLYRFLFSDDGSRIAALSRQGTVGIWNCATGDLIGVTEDVQSNLAISGASGLPISDRPPASDDPPTPDLSVAFTDSWIPDLPHDPSVPVHLFSNAVNTFANSRQIRANPYVIFNAYSPAITNTRNPAMSNIPLAMSHILNNPAMLNILNTPTILNVLNNPAWMNIFDNPAWWDILNNPAWLNIINNPAWLNVLTTPDITNVASSGSERDLVIRVLASFKSRLSTFPNFAVSPDGSLLATWERGCKVKLWNGSARNPLPLIETLNLDVGNDDDFHYLAFSRDGILALASSDANAITLYDAKRLSIITTLATASPTYIAFSPDSSRLVSQRLPPFNSIALWDIPIIKVSSRTSGRQADVTTLSFSPDCFRLAAGFENGTMKLWDTDDLQQLIATHECFSKVTSIVFSNDGRRLACSLSNGKVNFWDGKNGELQGFVKLPHTSHVLAISNDTLVCQIADGTVVLLNPRTLNVISTLRQQGFWKAALFSHTDSLLVIYGHSTYKSVIVWDIGKKSQTMMSAFQGWTSTVVRVVFSDDDSQIAAVSFRGEMKLYDIASNETTTLSKDQASLRLRLIPCCDDDLVFFGSLSVSGEVYGVSIPYLVIIIHLNTDLAIPVLLTVHPWLQWEVKTVGLSFIGHCQTR